MNYIDFDSHDWIQINAINASVYKDNNIAALIATCGTTDAATLLSECGVTLVSGSVSVVKNNNYYKFQVTSTQAIIGISYAICGVKFNDHSHTDTYTWTGQNQTSFSLPQGTYGFDELNILINPNYLYLYHNIPYFSQLGHSLKSTNPQYSKTSPLPEIQPSFIDQMYNYPIPSSFLDWEQYSMPNYNMNNCNIHSVGLHKKESGENPFQYEGRVFGNISPRFPPAYFGYKDFIPQIIYVKGYVNDSGYTCSSYNVTSTGVVTVNWTKTGNSSITMTYNINENCKLVRYRRSNTNYIIDTDKNFIDSSFFQFKNFTGYYDYYVMLLGNRINTTDVLPLNITYTLPMTMDEYQSGSWSTTTNTLYKSLIKRKHLIHNYTLYTTGDFAPQKGDFYVTAGRSENKNSKKYTTRYSLKLDATIDEVSDLPVALPSTWGWSIEPHLNELVYGGGETINNPPPIGSSFPATVSEGHCLYGALQWAWYFRTSTDTNSYATVPNWLYLSQLQHTAYFDDLANYEYPIASSCAIKNGETDNWLKWGKGTSGEWWYARGCWVNTHTLMFEDLGTSGEGSSSPAYMNTLNRRIKIDCSSVYVSNNSGETQYYEVLVLWRKDWYINPYDD